MLGRSIERTNVALPLLPYLTDPLLGRGLALATKSVVQIAVEQTFLSVHKVRQECLTYH